MDSCETKSVKKPRILLWRLAESASATTTTAAALAAATTTPTAATTAAEITPSAATATAALPPASAAATTTPRALAMEGICADVADRGLHRIRLSRAVTFLG